MGAEQMDVGKHTLAGRFAGPGITALVGGGVQLTGYQNEWLGYALFIVAAIWALAAFAPSLRGRYKKRQAQQMLEGVVERLNAPSYLDLAAPDARPKGYGVAQEEDGTPRIGYMTFGRVGEQKIKIGSDLRPLAIRVFEPLKRNIRAKDLPVTIRSPEHDDLPILTVNRFVNGGIWIEEESRGGVVRFRVYFGDDDWTPPYSESQLP